MKEQLPPTSTKEQGRSIYSGFMQMIGASALTVVAVAGFPVGASFVNAHHHSPEPEPKLSSLHGGVLSLVVEHSALSRCTKTREIPPRVVACEGSPAHPTLLLEQCHEDVRHALAGRHTVSFSNNPSELTAGCFEDWVLVSAEDWCTRADASNFLAPGFPSERLLKATH